MPQIRKKSGFVALYYSQEQKARARKAFSTSMSCVEF